MYIYTYIHMKVVAVARVPCVAALLLRVQGSGFRVQGAGCRVQGAGFRVQGAGFRVQGSGCRVQGYPGGVPHVLSCAPTLLELDP